MKNIFFALLIVQQAIALTCSDPVTIAQVHPYFAYDRTYRISMNNEGIAALTWIDFETEGREEEVVKASFRESGRWSTPITISNLEEDIYRPECRVDALGNIHAFWESSNEDLYTCRKSREAVRVEKAKLFTNLEDEDIIYYHIDREGKVLFFNQKALPLKQGSWRTPYALSVMEKYPNSEEDKTEHFGTSDSSLWSRDIAYQTNGQGNQIVIWEKSRDSGNNPPYDTTTIYGTARRNGTSSWTEGSSMTLSGSEFKYIHDLTAAMDRDGNVCVLGSATSNEDRKCIWACLNSSRGSFSTPVLLVENIEELYSPQILADPQGNFLAIWKTLPGKRSILHAAFKAKGQAWSSPVQLTPTHELNIQPLFQVDAFGNFVLVWQHVENWKTSSIHGTVFSSATQQWSVPIQLSPKGQDCDLTSFALNEKGEGAISWTIGSRHDDIIIQVANLNVN